MSSDLAPSARSGVGAAILMIVGIILLLPGICSLVTVGIMVADSGIKVFAEPYTVMFMILWVICGLITWAGIAMIRAGSRRFMARVSRNT